MELSEATASILEKYKYSNVGLEDTMQQLVTSLGYEVCKSIHTVNYANDLCDYKWNKMTKVELIHKILDSNYFDSSKLAISAEFTGGFTYEGGA